MRPATACCAAASSGQSPQRRASATQPSNRVSSTSTTSRRSTPSTTCRPAVQVCVSLPLAGEAEGRSARCWLWVGDAGAMSTGDLAIRNQLLATNYDVTVVSDEDATVAQADGHDAVFVTSSSSSSVVGSSLNATTAALVTSKAYLFDDIGLVTGGFGTSSTSQVTIVDPAHPLAAGLSGVVTMLTTSKSLGFGSPAPERGDRRRCHRYAGFVPLPTGGPSCRRYASAELPSRVPGLEDIGRLAHSRGMAAVRRDVQRARRRM